MTAPHHASQDNRTAAPVALALDDPPHQPRAPKDRRHKGRQASGQQRLDGVNHDRASISLRFGPRTGSRSNPTHTNDITEADAHAGLQQLDPLWDELFPTEQVRIVALIFERVDIGTDGLNVRLRVDGLSGLAREMQSGGIGETA